jgi:hypothetical protein
MLDLIATEARELNFAAEELKQIETVKARSTFGDKVKFSAVILPPSLRPGGHNPIDQLHDIASEAIHKLDEDECVEIFDRTRAVFEYLFDELESRRLRGAEYALTVSKLASRKAKTSK